jgi:hypothetical protein
MPQLQSYKTAALYALIALLGLSTSLSQAQTRPSSLKMSCAAATQLIQSEGAVVISTGPDLYDRYVRNQTFCGPSEEAVVRFIPTRDNPSCFAGYGCRQITGVDNNP